MRLFTLPLLAVGAACSGAPGPRVVVLPEVWVTARPESAAPAAARIRRQLDAHQLRAVPDDVSRAALAAEGDTCVEDIACLRRIGERVGAGKLVTLKLAELGETVAVQVALVDVRRAAREATLREVVSRGESARLTEALDSLGTRIATQAMPERRRSRAWLWVGAGGLAVGAAAAAIVLATRGEAPDRTIVPP